ncbi:MAG: hypothetical protein MRK01_15125 [Candidatus Scalindua sp.]|nr:hypothetical protein [Candidatus Scalindua sp.]
MIGGLLRDHTERKFKEEPLEKARVNGILFSSGLIAGSALVGVGLALVTSYSTSLIDRIKIGFKWMQSYDMILSVLPCTALTLTLWTNVRRGANPEAQVYQTSEFRVKKLYIAIYHHY